MMGSSGPHVVTFKDVNPANFFNSDSLAIWLACRYNVVTLGNALKSSRSIFSIRLNDRSNHDTLVVSMKDVNGLHRALASAISLFAIRIALISSNVTFFFSAPALLNAAVVANGNAVTRSDANAVATSVSSFKSWNVRSRTPFVCVVAVEEDAMGSPNQRKETESGSYMVAVWGDSDDVKKVE